MSAPDMIARGLAARASLLAAAPFAQLSGRAVPPGCDRIDSSAHAAGGIGAARYLHDARCTDELLADHPGCTFRAADGRVFRLMPEAGGIAVEQAGAIGDGVTDDQPAIQAALDYAAATGIGEVRFTAPAYRLHCPERTSPANDIYSPDGHPLVARASVTLRGVGPARSTLDFRGLGGADPETNWQVVPKSASDAGDAVWRGGGLFALADQGAEAPETLAIERLEIHRLNFIGNRQRTGQHSWPANPATGDGWDTSDKAVWLHDTHIGDVVIADCDFIGWKGEIYFGGAKTQRSLTIERTRLLTTNANAFNPGTNCPLVARDCEFGDARTAQEDTGKTRAQYSGCLWRDSDTTLIGSGATDGITYHYLYPTRDAAGAPPITQLDGCEFRNIPTVFVGCWVRGRIRTTDATVDLSTPLYSALRDIDLDIDATIDAKNAIVPLRITGPATLTTQIGNAPAGTYQLPPRDIHVTLRTRRTQLARDGGRQWYPPSWTGYVTSSVRLVIDDCVMNAAPTVGHPPVSVPAIEIRNLVTQSGSYGTANMGPLTGATTITPNSPLIGCYFDANGPHDMALARFPTGGSNFAYAHGQKVKIRALSDTPGAGLKFAKGTKWWMKLAADRVLSRSGDWIEFTYNAYAGSIWEETGFFTTA